MPGAMTIARGNELMDTIIAVTITPPASIVATASTLGTYTIAGLLPLDYTSVTIQSSVTNYSVDNAYVSAANTLIISFSSTTGGTVSSAPAVNVLINVTRMENQNLGFAALPSSIQ